MTEPDLTAQLALVKLRTLSEVDVLSSGLLDAWNRSLVAPDTRRSVCDRRATGARPGFTSSKDLCTVTSMTTKDSHSEGKREQTDEERAEMSDGSAANLDETGERLAAIEKLLAEQEIRLVAQEHRPLAILRDIRQSELRSEKWWSALTALFVRMFLSHPAVTAGAGLVAVLGVGVAALANHKLERQNQLIAAQNDFFRSQIRQQALLDFRSRRAQLIATLFDERPCWDGETPAMGHKMCSASSIQARGAAAVTLARIEAAAQVDRETFPAGEVPVMTDLNKTDLRGAMLAGADFHHVSLSHADLTGATLLKANLEDSFLIGSNLSKVDLSNARLHDAKLFDVNLRDANLSGADLSCAVLVYADLTGADLSNAIFIRDGVHQTVGLTLDQLRKARNVPREAWQVVKETPDL